MILDISPVLKGEVRRQAFEYTVAPIPMRGIEFCDNAQVTGEITDDAGYMRLHARVHVDYNSHCDRCLEPVSGSFDLDFDRTVAAEGVLTEEQIEENVDEFVIVDKGMLDIDEQIAEALLLEFPKKILCDESCPGLCPKCGKNLKYGKCSCLEKEQDPRLAVLAQLLDKKDEQ